MPAPERGFGLPLFHPGGGFRIVEDSQRLRELILSILLTRKGERVMRPDFGSDLMTLAFQPNTEVLRHQARLSIVEALARWEPRVEVVDVRVEPEARSSPGTLSVILSYRIKPGRETQELSIPLEP
jgi:phage baseplate assembly protein W